MAVLSDPTRATLNAEYQRAIGRDREGFGSLTKADLLAAVNAIDAFLDANAATINSAFPLPARTVLTSAQKARLLSFVIQYRYIAGA